MLFCLRNLSSSIVKDDQHSCNKGSFLQLHCIKVVPNPPPLGTNKQKRSTTWKKRNNKKQQRPKRCYLPDIEREKVHQEK